MGQKKTIVDTKILNNFPRAYIQLLFGSYKFQFQINNVYYINILLIISVKY